MKLGHIDEGAFFDFGRVAKGYANHRDIYPDSLYQALYALGVGRKGQAVLDIGSGTGVLPRHLYGGGASFTVTDISDGQLAQAKRLAKKENMQNMDFRVCGAEKEPTGLPWQIRIA